MIKLLLKIALDGTWRLKNQASPDAPSSSGQDFLAFRPRFSCVWVKCDSKLIPFARFKAIPTHILLASSVTLLPPSRPPHMPPQPSSA